MPKIVVKMFAGEIQIIESIPFGTTIEILEYNEVTNKYDHLDTWGEEPEDDETSAP